MNKNEIFDFTYKFLRDSLKTGGEKNLFADFKNFWDNKVSAKMDLDGFDEEQIERSFGMAASVLKAMVINIKKNLTAGNEAIYGLDKLKEQFQMSESSRPLPAFIDAIWSSTMSTYNKELTEAGEDMGPRITGPKDEGEEDLDIRPEDGLEAGMEGEDDEIGIDGLEDEIIDGPDMGGGNEPLHADAIKETAGGSKVVLRNLSNLYKHYKGQDSQLKSTDAKTSMNVILSELYNNGNKEVAMTYGRMTWDPDTIMWMEFLESVGEQSLGEFLGITSIEEIPESISASELAEKLMN
jgi:hypothetical protein